MSQSILGVKPTLDGLWIDPCVPSGCKGFTVTRRYRGARYVIRVKNPGGAEHGVKELRVNGARVNGNLIPPHPAGETVTVEVLM